MINSKSLYFAPMEGVTDSVYRQTINQLYPQWDYLVTDFLRASSTSPFPLKMAQHHLGQSPLEKTIFQILATPKTYTESLVRQVAEIGVKRLDLNLGCPSKTVNNHLGGAYLLGHPVELRNLIRIIRTNYNGVFSVKMRIGVSDDGHFLDHLKMFVDEGVEAITLHARTRDQLYKGRADWSYIAKAVSAVNIPIIANGDIWTVDDYNAIYEQTGCHSVMLGRGALKTPWFAKMIKDSNAIIREKELLDYFSALKKNYELTQSNSSILKRFKSLIRYSFEDFEHGEDLKRFLLRCDDLQKFIEHLQRFSEGVSIQKIIENAGK